MAISCPALNWTQSKPGSHELASPPLPVRVWDEKTAEMTSNRQTLQTGKEPVSSERLPDNVNSGSVRIVPIRKAAGALIVFGKRYLAFRTGWVTVNSPRADDTSPAVKLTASVLEHSSHTISACLFPPKSILGRQAVWLYEHCLPDWNSHSQLSESAPPGKGFTGLFSVQYMPGDTIEHIIF